MAASLAKTANAAALVAPSASLQQQQQQQSLLAQMNALRLTSIAPLPGKLSLSARSSSSAVVSCQSSWQPQQTSAAAAALSAWHQPVRPQTSRCSAAAADDTPATPDSTAEFDDKTEGDAEEDLKEAGIDGEEEEVEETGPASFRRAGGGGGRGGRGGRGPPGDGFNERVLQVRRVTKVVKGGKQLSFRAVVVVGKEGQVGVGVGKAKEVVVAVTKAVKDAKRHLVAVPMTKYKTFPHRAQGRFGAARVMLRPAATGTGVIAGGAVRVVLELAGLENALGKELGSGNPLNNARAVLDAVSQMKQFKDVAAERGIPMETLWK